MPIKIITTSFSLLFPRCRHAAIAKYFGDVTPPCNKCCDYCKNPGAVKRQLESLERCSNSWSKTCIGPTGSSWDSYDPELYEGGRRGCRGFSRSVLGSSNSVHAGYKRRKHLPAAGPATPIYSTCFCVVVFSCNFLAAGAGISFSTHFGSLDHIHVPESQKPF